MQDQGGASTSSVSDLSVQKMRVEFDSYGKPIGENSIAFVNFLGSTTRTHCPIYCEKWRDVSSSVKEKMWKVVKNTYCLSEAYKVGTMKSINVYWRNYKYRLRVNHYDKWATDEERKNNRPDGLKKDWEKFVDTQSVSTMIVKRHKGKRAREAMKNHHTSGRLGVARVAHKMRKENPGVNWTRTDSFLAIHHPKDGTILTPETRRQIAEIKLIIAQDPSSTSLDIYNDPVAQVCGPEGKGRVRAAGTGISRTSMLMSAPAIEQVNVEKQKSMTIMEQVKAQGQQIAKLCKVVMELEQSVSQSSHRQPTESASSHARQPAMSSTFRAQRNNCRLSCFGGGVVAHGKVQNTTSLDGNGELYNVLVEVVLDPTAQLFKHNGSMSTFGDVVAGITIIEWPKVFNQFLSP